MGTVINQLKQHRRTIVVLCMAAVAWAAWRYRHRAELFDQKRWQPATNDTDYEPRYCMVGSVRKMIPSGQLKQQDAIRVALGAPDQERAQIWLYNLGAEHGSMMRIDNDWLELVFHHEGTIVSHRVRPD